MILEFLAGCGPASERMGEWLDAHPGACLAIIALLAVLVTLGDAVQGAI